MRLTHRTVVLAAVVAALAAPVAIGAGAAAGARAHQTFINWPAYQNGPTHRSDNSAAKAITPATVPGLTRIWTWKPAKPTMKGQPAPRLYSSPTVYNGVVYIGAGTGIFYALAETTGKVLWQHFLGWVPAKTCGARGIDSTATVAPDPVTGALTVYVSSGDGYLFALRAATGKVAWKSVIALPSPTKSDYYDWSSPSVVKGRIYIGLASQCDDPLVKGGLNEYDQATGKLLASYEANPGGQIGASIWSSASVPVSGNYVVVTTGNAKHGDSESIVRLNGKTLAKEAIWTLPLNQQTFDADFGSSPTFFNATLSGKPTEMVGACNKNGIFYALRRGNIAAGPVWEFRVGAAYTTTSIGQCDASAVWDGTHLFIAGDRTTIGGSTFSGSVRMVDPATGTILWARGLPGPVIGTPTLDGGGVLTAQLYNKFGVYLLDAATGAILRHIPAGVEFGQAVFADHMLLVPTQDNGLWAYR
jgi:outer membrane protein assembly factor BamB